MKPHVVAFPLVLPQHGPVTTPRGLFRLLLITVCLSFSQSLAGLAQTNAPTPLPPAAQEALDKGIIAAKVPDYLLAIRFFEEARKTAPEAPVIYLNMGLAESRIPGRELRAIAWFGAYLAAYPSAPNAAVVKEQIAVLDVRNLSDVSRLLNSLQVVAGQASRDDQSVTVSRVAELWAKVGDIEAAVKEASLIPRSSYTANAWKAIAEGHLKSGDLVGAQRAVTQIQDDDKRIGVEIGIIHSQIVAGDIAGAREALASMKKAAGLFVNFWNRVKSLSAIAALQMKIGDSAGAQSSFVDAKMNAEKMPYASDKAQALTSIAEAQFTVGDTTGGQSTIATAQMTAGFIEDDFSKNQADLAIAQVYLKSGDIGRARQAAERFESYYKTLILKAIIDLQIRSGDIVGALKTAEPIEMLYKNEIHMDIAEAQIQAGDMKGANDTLAAARRSSEAIDSTFRSGTLARLAEVQAKTGDLAGARATLTSAQKAADLTPWNEGGITAAGSNRRNAQAYVIKTQGKLGVISSPTITWLDELYDSRFGDCPLNHALFLDLAGHLQSLPPSNKPLEVFNGLEETAVKIIKARDIIKQQLKAQIGK